MDKKKILTWAIVILLVANLSAVLTLIFTMKEAPGEGRHYARTGKDVKDKEFFNDLGLNTAQKDVMDSLKTGFHNQRNNFRQQMDAVRAEIMQEVRNESMNFTRMDSLSEYYGQLQAGLQKAANRHFVEVRQVLTPEQKEALDKKIGRFKHAERSERHKYQSCPDDSFMMEKKPRKRKIEMHQGRDN